MLDNDDTHPTIAEPITPFPHDDFQMYDLDERSQDNTMSAFQDGSLEAKWSSEDSMSMVQ
jgi:hypothetical protein